MLDILIQTAGIGFLFYGIWQMGNHRLRGPVLVTVAEALMVTTGLLHPEVWSLIAIGLGLGMTQARNAVKWYREGVSW
jgi:ABC-type dipeptide/oligopeptide/nickel transport system permease component